MFGFAPASKAPSNDVACYSLFSSSYRQNAFFSIDALAYPINYLESVILAADLIVNGTTVFGASGWIYPYPDTGFEGNIKIVKNGATLETIYNAFGGFGSAYSKNVSLALKLIHPSSEWLYGYSGDIGWDTGSSYVKTFSFYGYMANPSYVSSSTLVPSSSINVSEDDSFSSYCAAKKDVSTLQSSLTSAVNYSNLAYVRANNAYNIVSNATYGNAAIKNTLGSPVDTYGNQTNLAVAIGKPSMNNLPGVPTGLHQVLGEPPLFTGDVDNFGTEGYPRSIHSILGTFYDNPGYNISTLKDYLDAFDESFSGFVATYLGKIFRAVVKNQDVDEDDPAFKTIYGLLSEYLGVGDDDYSNGVIPSEETISGKAVAAKTAATEAKSLIGKQRIKVNGVVTQEPEGVFKEIDDTRVEIETTKNRLGTEDDDAGDTTIFARVKKLENLLGIGSGSTLKGYITNGTDEPSDSDTASLTARIKKMKLDLEGKFTNTTSGLDSKITDLETVKSNLDSSNSTLASKLSEFETKLGDTSGLGKKITDLETVKSNFDSKINDLENVKSNLDSSNSTLASKLSEFETKLGDTSGLGKKITDLGQVKSDLDRVHGSLSSDISGLPSIRDAIGTPSVSLADDIGSAKESIDVVSTTTNSTHRSVTALNLLVERIRSVLSRRNK